MTDDRTMVELLGGAAERQPDPAFRIDVFARISERKRRRAALWRAFRIAIVFVAVGLVFPAAGVAGVTSAEIQPFLLMAGLLGLAYLLALVTIEGPERALARSRSLLRVPL